MCRTAPEALGSFTSALRPPGLQQLRMPSRRACSFFRGCSVWRMRMEMWTDGGVLDGFVGCDPVADRYPPSPVPSRLERQRSCFGSH